MTTAATMGGTEAVDRRAGPSGDIALRVIRSLLVFQAHNFWRVKQVNRWVNRRA